MIAFFYGLDDQSHGGDDIHRNGVACQFVELAVLQTDGDSFVELLIRKTLKPKTLDRHKPADDTDPPDTVSVLCGEGEHGFFFVFDPASLLSDGIPLRGKDGSGSHHEDTGSFCFVLADTGIDPCGDASGILRDLRFHIQVDEYRLGGTAGQGVGDFVAHPSATAVDAGIGGVDAVTGVGHLITRLGQHLHRDLHIFPGRGCLEGQIQYTVLSFLRTLRHRL